MPRSDQALHKSLKIVYILVNRTGPDEEPRDIAISTTALSHSFPKATGFFWYTRVVKNTILSLINIKYTCKNECFSFFYQISDRT